MIVPLAQRGEIVFGDDVGVHDDCGLILALIPCGKAVQRVQNRTGFADIFRQNFGSAWVTVLIRGQCERDQGTIVPFPP